MSKDLLKDWTKHAYGLLDNVYDTERIEDLNKTILDLSKVGISDLIIYKVEEDGITVRFNNRGSKSFQKVSI